VIRSASSARLPSRTLVLIPRSWGSRTAIREASQAGATGVFATIASLEIVARCSLVARDISLSELTGAIGGPLGKERVYRFDLNNIGRARRSTNTYPELIRFAYRLLRLAQHLGYILYFRYIHYHRHHRETLTS
jgi:hypothetical protein